MHQFIGQNFTKPCCEFTEHSSLAPNEYWNSAELASVRTELENGTWPSGCSSCQYKEENNQLSLRQRSLQEYAMPNIASVEYLDVRLSNKCNFACRSCEPIFSSRIAKEAKVHKLKKFYGYELDKNYVEHSNQISQDVQQMLPTVKKLMFTGGEPTYIKQFYDILDVCNPETQLLVTTNASMIDAKFLSYAKRFPNLHITLSIDAVGEPAEYIRYGTDWNTVDENIQKILGLKCSVMFNTVLSAYSVPYLETLVDYIIAHEQDAYSADMYICTTPKHLHPCVLPQDTRKRLTTIVTDCIVKLNNSKRQEDYKNCIQVLTELNQQLQDTFIDNTEFYEFTETLDIIRGQKYDYWNLRSNRIR